MKLVKRVGPHRVFPERLFFLTDQLRRKVLVYDKHGQDILSPLVRVTLAPKF